MLRWYLDFPDGAVRNDVELPAGRVFFTGACWDVGALEDAEAECERLEDEIEAQSAEVTRLAKAEGAGVFGKLWSTRKAVLANDKLVNLRRRLQDRRNGMPDGGGV